MNRGGDKTAAAPYAGVAIYFPEITWKNDAGADELASLLTDDRWPWLPWWFSFSGKHRRDDIKNTRVGSKSGMEALRRGLRIDGMRSLYMNRSTTSENFARIALDLNEAKRDPRHETSFEMLLTSKATELPAGKSFDNFLSLVDDLIRTLGGLHAAIGIWPSYDWAICDTWLMKTVLDTPRGDVDWGLPARFQEQVSLTGHWSSFFGRTCARHPRWGNYLNASHLAAIGGIERIQREVAPAVIRSIGPLTYVQLTSSIDTAMSAEAGAKREQLEALMDPILPKPDPVRT